MEKNTKHVTRLLDLNFKTHESFIFIDIYFFIFKKMRIFGLNLKNSRHSFVELNVLLSQIWADNFCLNKSFKWISSMEHRSISRYHSCVYKRTCQRSKRTLLRLMLPSHQQLGRVTVPERSMDERTWNKEKIHVMQKRVNIERGKQLSDFLRDKRAT